jgi:hypothetical protein
MNRRNFIRVMLSLLLLMSQQMAMSHAVTHWAGSRHAPGQLDNASAQQQDGGISSAFAQDQTCEQCLAFAQIAGAIGSSTHSFAFEGAATCARHASATRAGCARTTCAFQPRGPPSFA